MTTQEQKLISIAKTAASDNQRVAREAIYRIWRDAFTCDKCPFSTKCQFIYENNLMATCYDVVRSRFEEMGC